MRPPDSWRAARFTLAVGILTGLAWLLAGAAYVGQWMPIGAGFIPARFAGAEVAGPAVPAWLTPLSATLVHAGIVHLAFNLLILLFCGRATEPLLGARGVAILYGVGAYAAAAAHYAVDPLDTTPMVGASGAISAVLGAYALLFGQNRVRVAHPGLALALHVAWLAAAWVVLQLMVGFTFEVEGARIAIAAHIGGFLAGLALARPLLALRWRRA